ncbi:MAG: hypothetical protein RIF46_03575, partial [Cyclobacteriaceae bacterium]
DWLTEGLVDYEYKKYILLAYLKDIRKRFNHSELYPFMSDLVFHYQNLIKVRDNKQLLFENFPKTLSRADFVKLKLTYDKLIKDDEVMSVIEDLIGFALPKLEHVLEEGRELYEFVESNIEFSSVGVAPIYDQEGYLLLNQDCENKVSIYRYQMTLFERSDEKYRSLTTDFIGSEVRSIVSTYESIKMLLIKNFSDLPNPATYLAISKLKFPIQETVLPIAKRMLVKELS